MRRRSKSIIDRIYWLVKDLKLGLRYRYPICCVWEFTLYGLFLKEHKDRHDWLEALNIHPGYMPCKRCFKKLLIEKKEQGDDKWQKPEQS